MIVIPALIQADDFATHHCVEALPNGEIHLWLSLIADATAPREIAARAREDLLHLLQIYSGQGMPPTIDHGEHGKPYVKAPGFPHFNLSHSGRCIVLAFSRDQELGVDVERASARRRHAPLELARRFFAAEESTALALLDASQLNTAFMHLWTCKESVLKALGHGLSFGLDRLQFALDENGAPASLQSIAGEAGNPEEWQIHRFAAAFDHIGSLAWRGSPRLIRTFLLQRAESL